MAADPAAALSQFAPLGFAPLPDGAAEIGGTTYHALYNDFGPSSIDGWLTDLAAQEMLIADDTLLDPDRRQLILDGTCADLTKLEFDVLQYLHKHQGRVVSRAALLRDVWGYDWSGGSNRRGRDQRPAPQTRRPGRKPADSARRRLPLHHPDLTPASRHSPSPSHDQESREASLRPPAPVTIPYGPWAVTRGTQPAIARGRSIVGRARPRHGGQQTARF